MSQDGSAERPGLSRLSTGIGGLDEVTGGGFLQGGVYILQGAPGAGKTILANQICFAHVARGGRVAYVTLLAESHARLLQHLQTMSFFDEAAIPESIYYISAFEALRAGGLAGVIALLRGEMRTHSASLLVLDGLVAAVDTASSDEMLKLFVSQIQAHSVLTGCTTLLLTSSDADRPSTAEQTMVDGLLLLRERAFGPRRERSLEIEKFRGSATLRGMHAFDISPDGITVHPRLEARCKPPPEQPIARRGVPSGIAGLDQMIGLGGLPEASVTVVVGYAGSGKTTLALQFIGQASVEEPAVYFSFYESPGFLVDIGRTFGGDLERLQAAGALEFVWQPYGEHILDALAYRLLDAVHRLGARRVVIDGLGGFSTATTHRERGASFFACLANELRGLGATTLVTAESDDAFHQTPAMATSGLSALADNLVTLRIAEQAGQFRRFISIGKMRNSVYDLRVREVLLSASGVRVDRRTDGGPADG